LKKIFPKELENGLLFADWISCQLIVPKSDCIEFANLGYNSIYEKEIVLNFSSGKLIDFKTYNNTMTLL